MGRIELEYPTLDESKTINTAISVTSSDAHSPDYGKFFVHKQIDY